MLVIDVLDLVIDACCLGIVARIGMGVKRKHDACTAELTEEREWMREQFVSLEEHLANPGGNDAHS